ncbi:hypothetical protein PR048_009497 [Dryococelus australis]|uniref:DUF4371 domain-containing protein n=1 Tax=Dryococelus australis TaxID=614101 RepID=A0ABQ9I018_9NEOP|nr:hypothetical protein PR048_009497 [Dryococelus australis]
MIIIRTLKYLVKQGLAIRGHAQDEGFYKTSCTTGKAISKIIYDSLLRLGQPVTLLTGQTYDGAGNMKGALTKIIDNQPLAEWLYRKVQIEEIVKKYDIILMTLHELSEDICGGASDLLRCFSNGSTYLGFVMANNVIDLLEKLNKSSQGRRNTLSGLVKSVETIFFLLCDLRGEDKLEIIFNYCCEKIDEMNLQPLTLLRIVKPPKRFCGPGVYHSYNKTPYSAINLTFI